MRSKDFTTETSAWQKKSGKNKNGGLNKKGVASYRKEHPGSKLQTAVTTKPSKLKKGSKSAKRRKSFCARMKGMKKHRTGAKTKRDPNSRINKSLRKWHCEGKEFSQSDYKIHDQKHLDRYLVRLCHMIVEGQKHDSERFGMVAACVLDPDHNFVARTSMSVDGKWSHAERNAMESYEREYGEIPNGSIILTTLSPCNGPMNDRYGSSCTDLINESNIRKVYSGYLDPSQHNEHNEFNEEVTSNIHIQKLCKKFADTFLGDENHPVDEGFLDYFKKKPNIAQRRQQWVALWQEYKDQSYRFGDNQRAFLAFVEKLKKIIKQEFPVYSDQVIGKLAKKEAEKVLYTDDPQWDGWGITPGAGQGHLAPSERGFKKPEPRQFRDRKIPDADPKQMTLDID